MTDHTVAKTFARVLGLLILSGAARAGTLTVDYQDQATRTIAQMVLPDEEFSILLRKQSQVGSLPRQLKNSASVREKMRALGNDSASGMYIAADEQYAESGNQPKPLCLLQFGSDTHRMIVASTGLPNQVVKRLIVLHESAHCAMGKKIDDIVNSKQATGSIDESEQMWLPASMLAVMNSPIDDKWAGRFNKLPIRELEHWQEVFADVISFMVLAQTGEDVSKALDQIIRFRKSNAVQDSVHDSSSSLIKVKIFLGKLENLPEMQAQFKEMSPESLYTVVLKGMHGDPKVWPKQGGA